MEIEFQGQYDKAIESYTSVIKLDREFYEAYNDRGSSYGSQGKFEQAIEDFNKAIEMKQDPSFYTNRGEAYHGKNNCTLARLDWDKACTLGDSRACNKWCLQ